MVPLPLQPKIPAPRHKPLSERRERLKKREKQTERYPSLASHSLNRHSALLPFRYLSTSSLSSFSAVFLLFSLLLYCSHASEFTQFAVNF